MFDIKGYKVKIDYAKLDGERMKTADFPNTVCITEL